MTEPLRWPNDWGQMRNNVTEVLSVDADKLNLILTNEIEDKDEIEKICAQVKDDHELIIRCMLLAGANVDPLHELENLALSFKGGFFSNLRATPG
jgi:hypothetical protein